MHKACAMIAAIRARGNRMFTCLLKPEIHLRHAEGICTGVLWFMNLTALDHLVRWCSLKVARHNSSRPSCSNTHCGHASMTAFMLSFMTCTKAVCAGPWGLWSWLLHSTEALRQGPAPGSRNPMHHQGTAAHAATMTAQQHGL